jgi:hypothetical protein
MEGFVGENVHFEFSSADASAAAVVTIYNNDGGARALAANERLVITDIHASAGGAVGLVDIFNGTGASPAVGERLFTFNLAATIGPAYPSLNTPAYCRKGVVPKVKAAAAGQLNVNGTGIIVAS